MFGTVIAVAATSANILMLRRRSSSFFKSKHIGLRKIPDFIYWNALFVLLTAIHYSTKTQGTIYEGMVEFFLYIWLASFISLIAIKMYAKEKKEVMDIDENLQIWHLDYIFAGLLAVEMIAVLFSMIAVQAQSIVQAMYVPVLSAVAPLTFQFYDDILFNIGLVATAEELSKAVMTRLFYMRLSDSSSGRAFSVLVPIAFWSLLHGYQAYVSLGEVVMYVMIAGAFCAGLVMYWVWKETQNILAAIIVHGFHNSIVIVSPLLRDPAISGSLTNVVLVVVAVGIIGVLVARNWSKIRK